MKNYHEYASTINAAQALSSGVNAEKRDEDSKAQSFFKQALDNFLLSHKALQANLLQVSARVPANIDYQLIHSTLNILFAKSHLQSYHPAGQGAPDKDYIAAEHDIFLAGKKLQDKIQSKLTTLTDEQKDETLDSVLDLFQMQQSRLESICQWQQPKSPTNRIARFIYIELEAFLNPSVANESTNSRKHPRSDETTENTQSKRRRLEELAASSQAVSPSSLFKPANTRLKTPKDDGHQSKLGAP